jgi:hypothetical protein
MLQNDLVKEMYSHLNLIVHERNAISLIKVSDMDMVQKIISTLPHDKYTSIITILHNMEDLSTMTPFLSLEM